MMHSLVAVCILFGGTAFAGEAGWEHVGLNGGGSMYNIVGSPHDPDIMMVSSDMGGAFLSRDGGRRWQMLHHSYVRGNTTCKPCFDSIDGETIFFPKDTDSRVLMVSRNLGRTWRTHVKEPPWQQGIRYIHRTGGGLLVGTADELFFGPISGVVWQRSSGVSGQVMAACEAHGMLFVATTKGVYRSEDRGLLFSRLKVGPESSMITGFAGNGRVLYSSIKCGLADGKLTGGIYLSHNLGVTWSRAMAPDLNVETRRSSKWANGDLPQYRHLLTSDANPKRAYVYCTGTSYYPPNHSTIYRTDDFGRSWQSVWFSDPRFKGQYNVEEDRISLSVKQRYQNPPLSLSINPSDPDTLMMSTDMMVFTTRNGGLDWCVSQSSKVHVGDDLAWRGTGLGVTSTWQYKFDPFDPHRHYICYTDVGFARSLDRGRSWIWEGYRLPWKNTVYDLAFDPETPGKMWGAFSNVHDIPNYNIVGRHTKVRKDGGVAVSLDYGETWQKARLPAAPCLSVVVDPKSVQGSRTLYAALFERGVWKSVDDGESWRECSVGLGSPGNRRVCRLQIHDDGTVFGLITGRRNEHDWAYDGKNPGLYRLDEGGGRWSRVTTGLPLHWPKDFDVNPKDSNDILLGAASVKQYAEGGLYRTKDGGLTWNRIAGKEREHFGGYFHPNRPGWIYMTLCEDAKQSGLYLSRDDGKTWEPFLDLPFFNIHRVHFPLRGDDKIYLTTYGGSVLRGPSEPGKPSGR